MGSRIRKLLWFGVSTAIIAGMVYFADAGRFIDAIRAANGWFLVPAFALGISVFGIWSYVWYSFFGQMGLDIGYKQSVKIFMSGQFMNSVTPLGQFGGEPIMAYLVSRNTEASYEKAFSTVLSADIVNAVPVFTFVLGGAVYLLLLGSLNRLVVQVVYISLLVTAVGGSLVYLLWFESGRIESGIVRISRFLSGVSGRGGRLVNRLEEKLLNVEEAFREIGSNPRHLLKISMVSHLGFVFQVFCLYFILLSVGVPTDFTPLYFVVALAGIGNFSPTPGGSGTFEALMAGLLTVFVPIQFASALVVAIIFRLTTYWPGILIGYVTLNLLENGAGK